jgi:hypothetical protein
MAVFLAKIGDVRAGGLEDPQVEQPARLTPAEEWECCSLAWACASRAD